MATISVVIPTRNRAGMLRKAIESARNAGSAVEIVVVNDASTDGTDSVCRQIKDILYVQMRQNVGLAKARNIGIRESTGSYIAFLDDDDLRLPGSLDRQLTILESDRSLGFVYGQVQIGDAETCSPTGEVRPLRCPIGEIFHELLEGNFIYVPSVLTRRTLFEEVGFFAEDIPGTEDWYAWLRLAAMSKVAAIPSPVAIYRGPAPGSGQMSLNRPRMCRSLARSLDKALRLPPALSMDLEDRRKFRLQFRNSLWNQLILEGDVSWSKRKFYYAAENYVTAVMLNPARAARVGTMKSFCSSIFGLSGNGMPRR